MRTRSACRRRDGDGNGDGGGGDDDGKADGGGGDGGADDHVRAMEFTRSEIRRCEEPTRVAHEELHLLAPGEGVRDAWLAKVGEVLQALQ